MEQTLGYLTPVGAKIMHKSTGRIFEVVYNLGDSPVVEDSQGGQYEIDEPYFKNYIVVADNYLLH